MKINNTKSITYERFKYQEYSNIIMEGILASVIAGASSATTGILTNSLGFFILAAVVSGVILTVFLDVSKSPI